MLVCFHGLCPQRVPVSTLTLFLRWEANSCGYHGDDGLLYRGHGKGEAFGPTYTSGDVVGAGINYASREFFFTVHVNFGHKPFTFDLKSLNPIFYLLSWQSPSVRMLIRCYNTEFEAQERMKQQLKIEEISVSPNVSHGSKIYSIVLSSVKKGKILSVENVSSTV
ncbi:Ran-binding protein 10, partial [Mucuna pruriens]